MSQASDLAYSYVFDTTAQALADGYDCIIHKGGTGSGKTFEIVMYIMLYFPQHNPGSITTVVSESLPHLKINAMRYADEILLKTGKIVDITKNQQDHTYKFQNGSIVEFFSADRIGKALGARRDLLYGNELDHIKRFVFEEMARRSKYIISDFNPTAEFWLEDWLQDYPKHAIIKSNYLHNPFLPQHEIERIRSRAARDPNFRRVHIDCEYGTSEGLVYQDFELIDEFPLAGCDQVVYGLDWGYVNDPTVLLMVGVKGQDTYLDELIYQTGLSNRTIIDRLQQMGFSGREIIYADVDRKSIDELTLAGFTVRQVVKGKVEDEIRRMRELGKVYISKRSVNTIKEIRNYRFATDRAGKPLNVPIKGDDHSMDAFRYARLSLTRKDKMRWS